MTMAERCACTAQDHPHHMGTACSRPAAGAAQEVEPGPDRDLGSICLECYQILAVQLHEADPDAMVDINLPGAFPACEMPATA